MSSDSSAQNSFQKRADDFLATILSYPITFWMILTNPRIHLPQILSVEGIPIRRMQPFAFLLTNIIIALIIEMIFGFSPLEFPLPDFLRKITLPDFLHQFQHVPHLPLAVIRYLLGAWVISLLLLLFISPRDFPFTVNRVAHVVSYASVVYLPLSLIGMLLSNIFDTFWSDIVIASINRQLPPLRVFSSIEFIFLSVLYLLGVLWWAYLLHIGLQSITLLVPYNGRTETLVYTGISYLGINFLIYISIITFYGAQLLIAKNQIEELKQAISTHPTNYSACYLWGIKVSANDLNPMYFRYKASMMAASCLPAVFLPGEGDTKENKRVIEAMLKSEHREARNILEEYYIELGKNKTGGYQSIHKMGRDLLNQADEFYKSPQFTEYKGDVNIGVMTDDDPIALFP